MDGVPLVSVVTPVLNEQDNVKTFYERVTTTLEAVAPPVRHEIVVVDDGSTDHTPALLDELGRADPRVRVVTLSRNFGHQAAITAGIDHAVGDAVVVMDSDLQDPPEVLPDMLSRWREGFAVVYGHRTARAGERRTRLMVTKAFYRLLARLADTPLPVDTGDFRLMDRRVVDVLREQLRESNRYIRGLVSWVGFSQCAVDFERDPRAAGEAKYTLRRLVKLGLDGITSFSIKPLRFATRLGGLVVIVSLLYAAWIVVQRLAFPETTPEGWSSVMVALLFLGGVQLLTIGLLGEYLGRTYEETKRRPLYVVAQRLNLDRLDDHSDGHPAPGQPAPEDGGQAIRRRSGGR